MQLTLLTPVKKILVNEDVESVFVPGVNGEMEILPNHAPLMSTMQTGVLRYKPVNGDLKKVAISWGYCEVSPAGVSVLAETAEDASEIDFERAKKAEADAEAKLSTEGLEADEIQKNLNKILRAKARQEVSQ